MVRIIFGSMVAWVAGVVLSASAAEAVSGRSWDFQADAIGSPPAGFTFGRTGEGPTGRWAIQLDPSAPAGIMCWPSA